MNEAQRPRTPQPPSPLPTRSDADVDAALMALFSALAADPRGHDFFALLRRIETLRPQWPRLGRALRPTQEALRLGQDAELDFAPAALSSFECGKGPAPRLGVRFFGLLGPQGPMPLHLTDYTRERARNRNDPTLGRFLDVFHHRMLALFYRAWAQAQPTVQQDRPADDRFQAWLGASFGRASAPLGAGPVADNARTFQAGLLAARSRHPEGLAKLLSQYFGVPVRIEERVAQWLPLDPEDRSRLGVCGGLGQRAHDRTAQIGVSAVSGHKLLDRQFKFRIVLGPLSLERYELFLPGSAAWPALRDWVRQYAGLDLMWDVQLVLARTEVPGSRLNSPRVKLGLTTWLGRHAGSEDRHDLRLRPAVSAA